MFHLTNQLIWFDFFFHIYTEILQHELNLARRSISIIIISREAQTTEMYLNMIHRTESLLLLVLIKRHAMKTYGVVEV
jgi:hypothetical protein